MNFIILDFCVILNLQHNMEGVLPRRKNVENLECTTNRIPISKLGKVAYLCRDLPIYELQTMAVPVKTHTGQRRKSKQNSNYCPAGISEQVSLKWQSLSLGYLM